MVVSVGNHIHIELSFVLIVLVSPDKACETSTMKQTDTKCVLKDFKISSPDKIEKLPLQPESKQP